MGSSCKAVMTSKQMRAAAVQRQQAWIVGGAVPAYSADDRTGRSDRRCSYYGSGRCEPWVLPTICRWRVMAGHPGFCVAGLRRAAGAAGARVGRRTHPVWPHRRLGAILFVYWRVFQHRQMAAPAGRAAVDGGVSRGRAGGTGRVRGKVVDESGGEIVALLV